MQKDFYQKELLKVRAFYNHTFGRVTVCDVKARQAAILSIAWMGVLAERISRAGNEDAAREDIRKFIRYRDVLTHYFNRLEIEMNERRIAEK